MTELPNGSPTQNIPITQLTFDLRNPRLPNKIKDEDENAVLKWMCRDGGVFDLMRSIGEQGYFDGEPVLVTPKCEKVYTVIEGNRRLAALQLLSDPNILDYRKATTSRIVKDAQNRPSEVPCIIYNSRDEILDYLGFRHVTGIKSWGPLAKARYLKDLSEADRYANVEGDEKYRQLARVIGSRVDYVKRILAGLKLYGIMESKDFYDINNLDEATISFSLVTTALHHPGIVTFLGLDNSQDLLQENLNQHHLEELTNWIFQRDGEGRTRLGESRHFGNLSQVVSKEAALDEFRQGRSLNEALMYTDAPVETFRKLLQEAKSNMQKSQEQLYLVKTEFHQSDMQPLRDIRALAFDIEAILNRRLAASDRQ